MNAKTTAYRVTFEGDDDGRFTVTAILQGEHSRDDIRFVAEQNARAQRWCPDYLLKIEAL